MKQIPLLTLLLASSAFAAPPFLQLSDHGRSMLPVVIASDASARMKGIANDLAAYLGRITGGRFEVRTGDGTSGIVVGLPGQFPAVDPGSGWKSGTVSRDDYLIATRQKSVLVLGASEDSVEHGVWDLLHRLGYRQFFPGERWEIVPHSPDLTVKMEVRGSPSYQSRRIWYGYGTWDYAEQPYRQWTVRNRMAGGMQLNTGHSYSGIIRALQKEFDQHPEFYALVEGQRKAARNAKLCISNEELRRLVVQYELEQFRKNPALGSVSLDPSDGGGWCECPNCKALGSVTDRVVLLANQVAAAVRQQFPGKKVGIYAYSHHSPVPSIQVDPDVVVSVATAFLKSDSTLGDLMQGWQRQGAVLGVREYYSVNPWDRDQPGQARGGNLAYLARTIPEFHARGVRYLSAEASDNWGPNGLGYYVASRLLWDVREARNVDAIVEDFLARAFGPAKEPMRDFYRQLDGSNSEQLVEARIERMFGALSEARNLAGGDPAVQGRLDDLTLYAQYCLLYTRYASAAGLVRQAAFESLIRHAYRMRTTMLVHAKALYRDLAGRDGTVSVPEDAKWTVPEGKNPWKSSKPFEAEEIAAMVRDGVRAFPAGTDRSAAPAYSTNLVPAGRTPEGAAAPGDFGPGRGLQTFLVHVEDPRRAITLRVRSEKEGRSNGARVVVAVWRAGGPSHQDTRLGEDAAIPVDELERPVTITVPEPGLYRITVDDPGSGTRVTFPADLSVVVPATPAAPMNPHYLQWTAYFYVPRGTGVVGLVGGEHGELQDSENRTIFWLNGRARGNYTVTVPQGQDGKVWRLRYVRSSVQLTNVPSYFAAAPGQLMVPAELAEEAR